MLKWARIKKTIVTNGTFVNFIIKSTLGFLSKYIFDIIQILSVFKFKFPLKH